MTKAFPAATEGVGGQTWRRPSCPTAPSSSTLTAEIVDWEVEPGKMVRGLAYNGQVPGPTIRVDTGDKVRVVLDNELPQSTAIHFHGIDVPNAMDGVPDITQPPVKPGETFTYEFVGQGPGRRHVPLAPPRRRCRCPNGLAGAFLIGDMPLPDRRADRPEQVPMMLNDAGTIGLVPQRQVVPGDRAGRRRSRATGS